MEDLIRTVIESAGVPPPVVSNLTSQLNTLATGPKASLLTVSLSAVLALGAIVVPELIKQSKK